MVNRSVWPFETLLGPSGPLWTISDKNDFFAPNGQSRVWRWCSGAKKSINPILATVPIFIFISNVSFFLNMHFFVELLHFSNVCHQTFFWPWLMTTIVTFESIMDVCPVYYQVPFIIIAAIALITCELQPLVPGFIVMINSCFRICSKGAQLAFKS